MSCSPRLQSVKKASIPETGVTESERPVLEWRDLQVMDLLAIVCELSICLPWLAGSWVCAANVGLLPALCCSFMFFLTGLRQVHNAC